MEAHPAENAGMRASIRIRAVNLCTACHQDFGSVSAFDRHRVGVHAYTFSEGAAMEPPRYDGRRCLAVSEMDELTDPSGMSIFARNLRGTWSLAKNLERARALRPERTEAL